MMERARHLVVIFASFLFALLGVLFVRLAYLHIATHGQASSRQEHQSQAERVLPARRGEILDRHGRVLASSVEAVEAYVYPPNITTDLIGGVRQMRPRDEIERSVLAISDYLSPVVGCSQEEIISTLLGQRTRRLGQPVSDPDLVDRLCAAKLARDGIRPLLYRIDLEKGWVRNYPRAEVGFNLLGWVGSEGLGASGLELGLQPLLGAVDGVALVQVDAGGREVLGDDGIQQERVSPLHGTSVVLTIDSAQQRFVEEALRRGVEKTGSRGAWAVLMSPATGDVLAMASVPLLDPSDRNARVGPAAINQAALATYPPGSTFKPVMMATALDLGLVTPGSRVPTGMAPVWFGKRQVSDTHPQPGPLSPEEILIHSSNIGMATILTRLVPENDTKNRALMAPVYEVLSRLGLGRRPDLPLPGTASGILRPLSTWDRNNSLVSISFGYEVAVSALQMASVVAALADGNWRAPRLVAGVLGEDGELIPAAASEPVPVWSRASVDLVRSWLVSAVNVPEKKAAQIPGIAVAGKTGTADVEADRDHHYHSFVALAPAEAPELALVVVLDDPQSGRFAAQTAVPVAGEILRASLAYLGHEEAVP